MNLKSTRVRQFHDRDLLPDIGHREVMDLLWEYFATHHGHDPKAAIRYSEAEQGFVADGVFLGKTEDEVDSFLTVNTQ